MHVCIFLSINERHLSLWVQISLSFQLFYRSFTLCLSLTHTHLHANTIQGSRYHPSPYWHEESEGLTKNGSVHSMSFESSSFLEFIINLFFLFLILFWVTECDKVAEMSSDDSLKATLVAGSSPQLTKSTAQIAVKASISSQTSIGSELSVSETPYMKFSPQATNMQ